MTDPCPHGHQPPHCPVTGCTSSRPAMALIEWKAADAAPRERAAEPWFEHKREAITTNRDLDVLAKRDTATGVMYPGKVFVGVQENGRRAHGAMPWWWRPVGPGRDGKVYLECQQDTPIGNVPGAVYEDSQEARHLVRVIGEAEAQRATKAEADERLREDCRHLSSLEVAERLGLTRSQLRRKRRGRRRAA